MSATHHGRRVVRIFALYRTATEGQHFGIVRSGTWAEVLAHLNHAAHFISRRLFLEGTDGHLRPLMDTGRKNP